MVHKKYTWRNGKRYGPYYYENRRVGERIITTYLGSKPPKKNVGETGKGKVWMILAFIFIGFIIFSFAYTRLTGRGVTEDLKEGSERPGDLAESGRSEQVEKGGGEEDAVKETSKAEPESSLGRGKVVAEAGGSAEKGEDSEVKSVKKESNETEKVLQEENSGNEIIEKEEENNRTEVNEESNETEIFGSERNETSVNESIINESGSINKEVNETANVESNESQEEDVNGNAESIVATEEFIKEANESEEINSSELNDSFVFEGNESRIIVNVVTSREKIRVGERVKWVKNVSLSGLGNVSIELPHIAEEIVVKKVGEGFEESVSAEIRSITGGVVQDGESDGSILLNWLRRVFRFTGLTVSEEEAIEVTLGEDSRDYVIEYYTEAPKAFEWETETGKRVVISGPDEVEYKDVIAFTDVPEGKNARVYWVEEGRELEFEGFDRDGNGEVDYIEWVVPHLSNQTFDILSVNSPDKVLVVKLEGKDEDAWVSDDKEIKKDKSDCFTDGNLDKTCEKVSKKRKALRIEFEEGLGDLDSGESITVFAKKIKGEGSLILLPYTSASGVNESNMIEIASENVSVGNNVFNLTSGFIGDLFDQGNGSFAVRLVAVEEAYGKLEERIHSTEIFSDINVTTEEPNETVLDSGFISPSQVLVFKLEDEGSVVVCHVPPGNPENEHTIEISEAAVPAHLAHGDSLGSCSDDDDDDDESEEGSNGNFLANDSSVFDSNQTACFTDGILSVTCVELSDEREIIRVEFEEGLDSLNSGDSIVVYAKDKEEGSLILLPYTSASGVNESNMIEIASENVSVGNNVFNLTSGFIGDLFDQGNGSFAVRLTAGEFDEGEFEFEKVIDATEIFANFTLAEAPVEIVVNATNSNQSIINLTLIVVNSSGDVVFTEQNDTFAFSILPGLYNVSMVPENQSAGLLNLTIVNANISQSLRLVGIDYPSGTGIFAPGIPGFALDSAIGIDFEYVEVFREASDVDLYKCPQWNFTDAECRFGCTDAEEEAGICEADSEWARIRKDLVPGNEYTFRINATDPGFSEYTESEGENSTTSTSFVNKSVLTFVPNKAGRYLILATAQLHGNSKTSSVLARVLVDGSIVGDAIWEPKDSAIANDYQAYGMHTIQEFDTNSHSIVLQWASETGATTFIKNSRISVISLLEASNSSRESGVALGSSLADITNLTVIPSVNDSYLIIASGELKTGSLSSSSVARLTINGVEKGNISYEGKDITDYKPFLIQKVVNLTSGIPNNISIEAQRIASAGGEIRRARVSAIRMTPDFEVHFAENDSTGSTSCIGTSCTSAFVNQTVLTFTPLEANSYLFIASAQFNSGGGNDQALVNLEIDGSDVCSVIQERRNNANPDQNLFVCQKNVTLSAASHTALIKFAAQGSNPSVSIRNARITAIKISPDVLSPNVTALIPTNGTIFNVTQNIEVGANVTDDFAVDFVIANITFPNGTFNQLALTGVAGDKYNSSFAIPDLKGRYNITFIASDGANINDSETTFFDTVDLLPPSVTGLSPVNSSLFAVNDSISLSANVVDGGVIDTVFANVSLPGGSSSIVPLLFDNASRYEGNFSGSGNKGSYQVRFFANDTDGNLNDSEITLFIVVEPDFNITKTDSPDPVQAGETITYIINYSSLKIEGFVPLTFSNITVVNSDSFEDDSPQMIESSSGTLIIIYHTNIDGNDNIYALRSTDKGDSWSSPIQVTNEIEDDQFPNVMEDNNGDIVVAYTFTTVGGGDIYIVNSSDDGLTWSEPFAVTSTTGFSEIEPAIDQDSSGVYHLIYTSPINGTDREIVIRNSSTLKGTWGGELLITNNSYEDFDAEILIDQDDMFYFAWAPEDPDFQEIWFANATNPYSFGFLDDNRIQVTDNDIYDYETSLNRDNNGNLHIGWVALLNTSEVGLANVNRSSNEMFIATSLNGSSTFFVTRVTDNNFSDAYPSVIQSGTEEFYYFTALKAAGADLDITFSKRDPNPLDASNITILDAVPDGTSVQSIGQGGAQNGGIITWNFSSLFAGDFGFVSFVASVNESLANGTIVNNTANLTYYSPKGEFVEMENYSTTTLVIDGLNPDVKSLVPVQGTEFNVSANITLSANVTDNGIVDAVFANVSIPGDGFEIVSLLFNSGTNLYEGNFSNTSAVGTYVFSVVANDSVGNVNDSESSSFDIITSVASIPTNISCDGGSCNSSFAGLVQIACNGSIDPEGEPITYFVEALFNDTRVLEDLISNASFEVNEEGFVYQDDLYQGTSSSVQEDGVRESNESCASGFCLSVNLNINSPTAGGPYSGGWNLSFNVSDSPSAVRITFNYTIRLDDQTEQTEFARLYYRNVSDGSEIQGAQLNGVAGIDGNDEITSGSIVQNMVLVNGTYSFDVGCYLLADQIDENAECWIDDVQIAGINTSITDVRWEAIGNHSEGSSFNWSILGVPPQSEVDLRCRAMDSGSNDFSAFFVGGFNLTILDIASPDVLGLVPEAQSNFTVSEFIEIAANVTDGTAVDSVIANITFPNGTFNQLVLVKVSGDKYNSTFKIPPELTGQYNFTIIANDTLGFVNNSEKSNFVAGEVAKIGFVQEGVITQDASVITDAMGSVNTSKAFVTLTYSETSDSSPDDIRFTPNMTSNTTLSFERYDGVGLDSTIKWQVIEHPDLRVQRGEEVLTVGESERNVTISVVNLNESFVIVYGRCSDDTVGDNHAGFFAGNLTNTTGLLLRRGNEGKCAATVSWQVIEWSGASVQSGETRIADSSDSVSVPLTSFVNQSRTFLVFSSASIGTDPGMDSNLIQGNITNTSSLFFTHEPGSTYLSSERIIDWYVVESSSFSVQSDSLVLASDSNVTVSEVNEFNSFHLSSGWNTGGGQTYANSLYTEELTNGTNLFFDKATSGQTHNIIWYLIELVAVNTAPSAESIEINSTDGSNRTLQDLHCDSVLVDDDNNFMNATVQWYNNSVLHLSQDFNSSFANGTLFDSSLGFGNTTKGENWTCGMVLFDGTEFGAQVNSSVLEILNSPPVVTLLTPGDASNTTDRTPNFTWSGFDDDNDALTFELNVTLQASSTCFEPNRHIQLINASSHELSSELQCFYDNGDFYNWSVRASDGEEFGVYATPFRANISSEIIISLPVNSIEFGLISFDGTNDTSDDSPSPFLIQNDGNAIVNVTIQGTDLWNSVSNPTSFYQFKIDNYTFENGSFNPGLSVTSYTSVPANSSASLAIAELNHTNATDSAEIDINVTVPSGEGGGVRSSTIVFTASLGEG